jgi:ribonuclease J
MIVRPGLQKDIKYIKFIGGNIIYSLWDGYKKDSYTNTFLTYLEGRDMKLSDLHTSGHADTGALKKLASALCPKNIIPIHTEAAQEYSGLFPHSHIILAQDGVAINSQNSD